MTTNDAHLRDLTSETAIVDQASRGVALAVDELSRRHGEAAWQLALAITGDPTSAAFAATDGMVSALTAVHAGRAAADHFLVLLLVHVRNAAVDRMADEATPIDDSMLAGALAGVPERWRSATWLSLVTRLSGGDVATVIGLGRDETVELIGRARMGIRQRYLAAHLSESGSRNCARAVSRLGAAVDHSLPTADMDKVERHLRLCAGCTERRALLVTLPADLAALAGHAPADLVEKNRAAIAVLAAPATSSGMSPRTEQILAGVSAFAAAVGVLGAALFGLDNAADRRAADIASAAPIAPLVHEVVTPRTIDLSSAIEYPATTIARRAAASEAAQVSAEAASAQSDADGSHTGADPTFTASGPTAPVATPPILDDALGGDGSDDGGGTVIGTTIPIVDVPVAVEVGTSPDEIGVTVGPVSIGSEPQPERTAATAPTESVVDTSASAVGAAPVAAVVDSATGSLGL